MKADLQLCLRFFHFSSLPRRLCLDFFSVLSLSLTTRAPFSNHLDGSCLLFRVCLDDALTLSDNLGFLLNLLSVFVGTMTTGTQNSLENHFGFTSYLFSSTSESRSHFLPSRCLTLVLYLSLLLHHSQPPSSSFIFPLTLSSTSNPFDSRSTYIFLLNDLCHDPIPFYPIVVLFVTRFPFRFVLCPTDTFGSE